MDDFCRSLDEMHFERNARGLRDGPQRARELAVGALFVGRLDALNGGLELIGFFHRLRQEMHARADGQHLPALAGIQIRHGVQGGLFGARQMIVVAHAERIVDRDDQHFAAAAPRARPAHETDWRRPARSSSSSATRSESSSR